MEVITKKIVHIFLYLNLIRKHLWRNRLLFPMIYQASPIILLSWSKTQERSFKIFSLAFQSYIFKKLTFYHLFKTSILILYCLMPRGKKQDKRVCTSHTFSIKPKEIHHCYYQQSISIKFCLTASSQGTSSSKIITNCYEGPAFNKDQNCSTPCFVMASDRVTVE